MSRRGFSAVDLVVAVAILAALIGLAIPMFGAVKLQMSFAGGEQAVQQLLTKARWSAINSPRPETRVHIEGNNLRIRAGTAADSPIVATVNLTEFAATVTGANMPLRLSPRGFRMNAADALPAVTIPNSRISAARTFVVGPLGKFTSS